MTKTSLLLSTAACLVANMTWQANAEETPLRFNVPDDVICKVDKTSKATFCTDKQGTPITGEMVKYFNGSLSRYYPMKDGYLEGTGISYYANGTKKSEIPYVKGIMNGVMKNYSRRGQLEEEIPYTNGKKEGVARYYADNGALLMQTIYIEDKANGDMRIYDSVSNEPIYNLKTMADKITSGTYTYKTPENEIKTEEIPEIVITAINNKCLDLRMEMTTSPCAAYFSNNQDCDQDWRKKNRKEVRKYLQACETENNNGK